MPGLEVLHQVAGSVKSVILNQPIAQTHCWAPASATPPAMMFATTLPGCSTAKSSWLILPIPETCICQLLVPSEEEADWVQVGLAKGAHANQG